MGLLVIIAYISTILFLLVCLYLYFTEKPINYRINKNFSLLLSSEDKRLLLLNKDIELSQLILSFDSLIEDSSTYHLPFKVCDITLHNRRELEIYISGIYVVLSELKDIHNM